MSLTTDGVWKANVWASTVWGEGVWFEGAAVAVTTRPAGGWKFFDAYDREIQRRRRKDRKRAELEEARQSIEDETDREIALLLQKQEAIDAHQAEIERLGRLARQNVDIEAARQFNERVAKAYERALEKGTFSALEALDRELKRALEEEEFLLMSLMMVM